MKRVRTPEIVDDLKTREEFEAIRQQAMRTFEVDLMNGTTEEVTAHYHDSGGAGHLCFMTIGPTGQQFTSKMFNSRGWLALREVGVEPERAHIAFTKLINFRAPESKPATATVPGVH